MSKLSKERRKELNQKYMEMKPPMGVFAIKNTKNGKVFMNVSRDLKSTFNSQSFQLKARSHRVLELQEDWNKYGEEAFDFEVLEYLKYDENSESSDYTEELEILKMVWLEKLKQDDLIQLY